MRGNKHPFSTLRKVEGGRKKGREAERKRIREVAGGRREGGRDTEGGTGGRKASSLPQLAVELIELKGSRYKETTNAN